MSICCKLACIICQYVAFGGIAPLEQQAKDSLDDKPSEQQANDGLDDKISPPSSPQAACEMTLNALLQPNDFALGRTKAFLKSGVLARLRLQRVQLVASKASFIQKVQLVASKASCIQVLTVVGCLTVYIYRSIN
ncbi:hypothetical protein T492DRAFT_839176 [Pavlovales sp. CCMP2436]|nr:hypothetical protein T492DRAFT_839176 [Pavlovales sp. CCMP2436]